MTKHAVIILQSRRDGETRSLNLGHDGKVFIRYEGLILVTTVRCLVDECKHGVSTPWNAKPQSERKTIIDTQRNLQS
jgi:hypothetical protein